MSRKFKFTTRLLILSLIISIVLLYVIINVYLHYFLIKIGRKNEGQEKSILIANPMEKEYVENQRTSIKYQDKEFKIWSLVDKVLAIGRGKPGEYGKPVQIAIDNQTFQKYQFNVLVSDTISLNRSLKDVRMDECKTLTYPVRLPSTSIIIVFHQEALSAVLRTIWSVVNRSPKELIEEIILVDDASDLHDSLEKYIKLIPASIRMFRMPTRSGIVRARLLGAKHATGMVMTFLDSHCECTEGWLEPLLARISENRKTVVCPIIDKIDDNTFEYVKLSDNRRGGFNWYLNFRWDAIPEKYRTKNRTYPIRTPVMAGGLFCIDRDYFYEIGSYDEGMDIWGFENIEMSFRLWQCGGVLEIIPCSHVGHVYRKISPHTFPGGVRNILQRNAARVAEVWMDEWKDFYYALTPQARNVSVGDLVVRRRLREKLKCESFNWYLRIVYPESNLNTKHLGDIANFATGDCFDSNGKSLILTLRKCHGLGGNQLFAYTESRQIRQNDYCLYVSARGELRFALCNDLHGFEIWEYGQHMKTIMHVLTEKCIENKASRGIYRLVLRDCERFKDGQKWSMNNAYNWHTHKNS